MTKVKLPKFTYDQFSAQQYLWVQVLIEGMDLKYADTMKKRISHIRRQVLLFKTNADKDSKVCYKVWEDILEVLKKCITESEEESKKFKMPEPSEFKPVSRETFERAMGIKESLWDRFLRKVGF